MLTVKITKISNYNNMFNLGKAGVFMIRWINRVDLNKAWIESTLRRALLFILFDNYSNFKHISRPDIGEDSVIIFFGCANSVLSQRLCTI